jgi:Secretion system C-terminal sorting domain
MFTIHCFMIKKIIIFPLVLLLTYAAQAQNDLFVSSGVTFKIDGTTTVTLADTKLTNNGTVEATTGSTLLVTGTATTANSSIVGTGTTTLAHLTIDKSSNDAQIDQNLSVSGDLTLTTGNLKLNAGNITFTGSGQIVGETNAKRIYGTGGELITTLALNAPTDVNPANLGATITSTADLGSTTIKRGHTVHTAVGGSSIARYYDINPTTNTGLNATLKFFYNDSELNGNAEANLNLWRSTNAGANWTNRGKSTSNTTDNFITLSQIDAFSRWTAAAGSVLPVELLSFSGKNTEGGNLLTWATASEVNNKGFEVERSPQPPKGAFQTWETIGFKTANNKASTYQFLDVAPPSGAAYYRLRQLDNDGKETLSKVISVVQTDKGKGLTVYPNPVSSLLTIENTDLSRKNREESDFQILNLLGQQVLTGKIPSGGRGLDVSALPQGTYFLKVGAEQAKFVKQ